MHFLGTSKLEWATLLTDVQRAVRKYHNPNFTISFDCASPFLATANGMIYYRGEVVKTAAIDGQAGTILRIYREHKMSSDKSFLKNNWNKIKLATTWVINQDKNQDGMEDTPIENTLDAVWDGEIAWLVGLCIAAVKAGEQMAIEMGDTAFATTCATYVANGSNNMEEILFNG
jgi:uncharacterized protein (DUF608 family)